MDFSTEQQKTSGIWRTTKFIIQNTYLDLTCLETVAAVMTRARFLVQFHMCKFTRLSLEHSKDRMGIHGGAKLSFSNSCFFASSVGHSEVMCHIHVQLWCGSREFIARPPCLQKSVRRIAIFRWGTRWDKSNRFCCKAWQPRYIAVLCFVLLSLTSHFTSVWLEEGMLFKISLLWGNSQIGFLFPMHRCISWSEQRLLA